MILNNADNVMLGDIPVDKIYLGSEEIWSRGGGLPGNYQAVEYLQSTGTQYIDTGFRFDNYWKYEIEASLDDVNNNQMWGMKYWYEHSIYAYNNKYWAKGDQYVPSQNGVDTNISCTTKCKFTFDSVNKTCDITGDNIDQHYTWPSISPLSSIFKFVLFACWTSWSDELDTYGQGKIYRFKLYQAISGDSSRELVADMIPCYRKSDDKPGMYDLVRQIFITNSGTGEFTIGPMTN